MLTLIILHRTTLFNENFSVSLLWQSPSKFHSLKPFFAWIRNLETKRFVYWMFNKAGYVSIMMALRDEKTTPKDVASRIKRTFYRISLRALILATDTALLSSRLVSVASSIRNVSHARVNSGKNSSPFAIQMLYM